MTNVDLDKLGDPPYYLYELGRTTFDAIGALLDAKVSDLEDSNEG